MQDETPERIYGWLNSQLSIARFYGGCMFQGSRYVIDVNAPDTPLVRADVLKREAKARRDAKRVANKTTKAAQSDLAV